MCGVVSQLFSSLCHQPVLLRLVPQSLHLHGEAVEAHHHIHLLILQPRQPLVHLQRDDKTQDEGGDGETWEDEELHRPCEAPVPQL